MKLISNTSFGKLCKSKEKEFKTRLDYLEWYEKTRNNFDLFCEQPLKLEMFVPCDQDGNVLEDVTGQGMIHYYVEKVHRFLTAKEKVLFEGFEFYETHSEGMDKKLNLFVFPYTEKTLGLTKKEESFRTWFRLNNIEDLVQCDLTLTPNAIKQLGL